MERPQRHVDVLIWPPGETEPVCAGQVQFDAASTSFAYDRNYLGHEKAISIYGGDLKMNMRPVYMRGPDNLAPSLRDALPDR